MQFIERKLRERFTLNVESIDEETCSVTAALWLQALTSQRMDYTVASSREGPVFGQALGSVSSVFDKWFIENKSIHKEDVFVALLPLARFVSSFPTLQEIKGHDELFMAHPTTPNSFGITPSGLKVRPLTIFFYIQRLTITTAHQQTHTGFYVQKEGPDRAEMELFPYGFHQARGSGIRKEGPRNRTV